LGVIVLADAAQATAAPPCKPALAFQQVSFSPIGGYWLQSIATCPCREQGSNNG